MPSALPTFADESGHVPFIRTSEGPCGLRGHRAERNQALKGADILIRAFFFECFSFGVAFAMLKRTQEAYRHLSLVALLSTHLQSLRTGQWLRAHNVP